MYMNLQPLSSILLVLILATVSCSKRVATASTSTEYTAQSGIKTHIEEVKSFQTTLNAMYLDDSKSPLTHGQKAKFKENGGHIFYEVNVDYRVIADLDTSIIEKNIRFETTTDRIAIYDLYGIATFELQGQEYSLRIFQNQSLRASDEYKDHLFLPFQDLTNGSDTYGGGRYIDLKIPNDDMIVIDFNKSYNPYCAYNHLYSCPVPPRENFMDEKILAGVKYNALWHLIRPLAFTVLSSEYSFILLERLYI